jgi:hypothetical protein
VVCSVLKSQVTNKFRTHNYSVVFCSGCLQNFVLAWGSKVRFPARAGNISLHNRVQNGSRAHPASYTVGSGVPFPGGKAAET